MNDISTKVGLVQKCLSAVFVNPPEVKIDEPTQAIMVDSFTISDLQIEKMSIKGPIMVPGYVLDVSVTVHNYPHSPDDVDVVEIMVHQQFNNILAKLVEEIARLRLESVLENETLDAMAKEFLEQDHA